MKKVCFIEFQILWVLKEVESGWYVKDVCCENGVLEVSYYKLEGEIWWYGVV